MRRVWMIIVLLVGGYSWVGTMLGGSSDRAIVTLLFLIALTLAFWILDGSDKETARLLSWIAERIDNLPL